MSENDADNSSSSPSSVSVSLKKLLTKKITSSNSNYNNSTTSEFAEDVLVANLEEAESSESEKSENNNSTNNSNGGGILFGKAAAADELKKWFTEKFLSPTSQSSYDQQQPSSSSSPNFITTSSKNKSASRRKIIRTNPELLFNKMLETCINFEPGALELEENAFFETDQAVWILGESYNTVHDRCQIKTTLRSILWFTYRKNFAPIGGTGPTSDQGWGCMLRCGQMLLAQALIRRHLGIWWRWDPLGAKDQQYLAILRMFQDKKSQMYSIHQIAQMGVSEGKLIGEWFGPNTVAHVLKKLTVYDDWSMLAVHVAMDNVVVLEHVRTVCRSPARRATVAGDAVAAAAESSTNLKLAAESSIGAEDAGDPAAVEWRPLLLIVPLRLGLANLNPVYIPALKEFFMLKQCLGAIGGRPNHALYFVGAAGDELIYLDPHYCQGNVDLDAATDSTPTTTTTTSSAAEQPVATAAEDRRTSNDLFNKDSSFHCPYILHMPAANIDPSLALAFYCQTEHELDDLCACFTKGLFKASDPPVFELIEKAPSCWPKFVPYAGEDAAVNDFAVVDSHLDTDEEFEIVH